MPPLLAGHVVIEDRANIGAYSGVHQFCRVGKEAYIGGYSVVVKDALPFALTVGNHASCYGLNITGMKRRGYSREVNRIAAPRVSLLLAAKLNTTQALERIREEIDESPEVSDLVRFIEAPAAALPNEIRIDCRQWQVSLHGPGGCTSIWRRDGRCGDPRRN